MGYVRQTVQQAQGVSCGDVLSIILGEDAQVPLAGNMFFRPETVARWHIPYYVDDTAETPPKIAYGAQCAATAIDAEGGD